MSASMLRTCEEETWQAAWKGRARGLWAGVFMGIAIGGVIGVLAAFSTLCIGVPFVAAAALAAPLAKTFAVIGMAMGGLTGTECGAVSGAAAGAFKMQQQGAKKKEEEQRPVPAPKNKPLFNGKVALTGLLAGIAVGSLIAATGGIGVLAGVGAVAALGGSAHAAVMAISIAGCALMGALFGVDLPTISSNLSRFTGRVLSGAVFEKTEKPVSAAAHRTESPLPATWDAPPLSGRIRQIVEGGANSPSRASSCRARS